MGHIDYSHKSAAKFSKTAPYTNALLACPECAKMKMPMQQFFWKYRCVYDHWARMHPTIEMPPSLVAALALHPDELAGLKNFAKSAICGGQSRKRARDQKTAAADVPERRATQIARLETALSPRITVLPARTA